MQWRQRKLGASHIYIHNDYDAGNVGCSKYRGFEYKIADALKESIEEAKRETKYSSPILSEIVSAFMEEAKNVTALALVHYERDRKDSLYC